MELNHFDSLQRPMETDVMTTSRTILLSLLLAVFCGGCAETSFIRAPGRLLSESTNRKQLPARILCLWEPAEGQGLDEHASRGFAGQILFFGYGSASPIPVHGTVRIYQYDNFDPDELDPKPIHVFVFDDAGWNTHRVDSTGGEAYNVFLPYVKRHQSAASCALKVEFIPEKGRPVSSPITRIQLEPRRRSTRPQPALTRQVAHRESASAARHPNNPASREASSGKKQLDSLTIRLPAATGR